MRYLRFNNIFCLIFLFFAVPEGKAGFNLLGLELGGASQCEIQPIESMLECQPEQSLEIRDLSDSQLEERARLETNACRKVQIIHEHQSRYPAIFRNENGPVVPSQTKVQLQIRLIDTLIAARYWTDALYWAINYRIEHKGAIASVEDISSRTAQILQNLMNSAMDLYQAEKYCQAANALVTFDVDENTHHQINRKDRTVDQNLPDYTKPGGVDIANHESRLEFIPADLFSYIPGVSDIQKWRESRFLQMMLLFEGGFYNEVRDAARKYRAVESERMQSKVSAGIVSKHALVDLALLFEAQSYHVQVPTAENIEGGSLGLRSAEEAVALSGGAAAKAKELFIRIARKFPDGEIARGLSIVTAANEEVLGVSLLHKIEDKLLSDGSLQSKTETAHNWESQKEIEIGKYYLRSGDFTAAAMRFNFVAENYKNSVHLPEALFLLSKSFAGLDDGAQELTVVETMERNFPNSEWTIAARREYLDRRLGKSNR